MSEKKLTDLEASRMPANCPVCGKPSYSPSGMHPQCAMAQADVLSRENRKKAAAKLKSLKSKLWNKAHPTFNRDASAAKNELTRAGTFQYGQQKSTAVWSANGAAGGRQVVNRLVVKADTKH